MSNIKSFYLIVTDRDNNTFNIVGPVIDDNLWNKKVCDCQNQGRQVNCQTVDSSQSFSDLIKSVESELNFKYTEKSII